MADVNRLVFAILKFLESQTQNSQIGDEAVESIEVAIQCLETAYCISTSDELVASQLNTNRSLLEIFNTATGTAQPISANVSVNLVPEPPSVDEDTTTSVPGATAAATSTEVSAETKQQAENLKSEGNNLMKNERYKEAVECYTKAISLDSSNAVYYSNRAAAYSKLDEHERAIQDCDKAVSIDPNYSKAYGRMGLAYTSLNQLDKAKDAYAKAVDLEPNNDSYQQNLQIAEQKLRDANLGGGGGQMPGGFPFGGLGGQGGPSLGGLNLGQVLQNPGLMNMAAQFMQDPQMQQMMQSMMGQAMQGQGQGQGQGPEGPPDMSNLLEVMQTMMGQAMQGGPNQGNSNTPGEESFSNLLQVGQNLASQIQQTNPELIEQLRQMRGQQAPPSDSTNPNNNSNSNGDGDGGGDNKTQDGSEPSS